MLNRRNTGKVRLEVLLSSNSTALTCLRSSPRFEGDRESFSGWAAVERNPIVSICLRDLGILSCEELYCLKLSYPEKPHGVFWNRDFRKLTQFREPEFFTFYSLKVRDTPEWRA